MLRLRPIALLAMLLLSGCYSTFRALDETDAGGTTSDAGPSPVEDAATMPAPDADQLACQAPGALASNEIIATRMAALLWDAAPDAGLLARTDLADPTARASEARRMLRDPRADAGIARIARTWLGLDDAPATPIDPATLELLRDETSRFVQEVVLRGDGRLDTVLLADWSMRRRDVAEWYGASAPEEWSRVSIASEPRRGVLTQGSMVVQRSTPTLRGLFVRSELFCNEIPPPPPDVAPLPSAGPTETRRDRYETILAEAPCSACHVLMDPIGFAFEGFGADGQARTTDNGFPIDDSGELSTTDVDGAFTGPIELAARLSGSTSVRRCVTQRWLEQALGHEPDECTMQYAFRAFASSGFDLNELLVAIVSSPGMERD